MLRDHEDTPPDPSDAALPVRGRSRPAVAERVAAFLEVVLCSDYPTQLAIAATLAACGVRATTAAGQLNASYIIWLSLADTALLVGLIVVFLLSHGESPAEVLLGRRAVLGEARLGVPLIFAALAIAATVLISIHFFAPALRTVPRNPLQDLIRSPRDVAVFALVVVVAGGVREEIQRAFLLRRFEQWLGGGAVGVVCASVAFGAGHLLQGVDAAIATGLLGAFWSLVYLRRRSIVAPVVSHSGFNLLQLVQALTFGR